ncbi:transducin family protein/WD-40 repeat family protein [Moesziomyces antarcticus]|uniref:Transducin family protein/WD-40 repeat family protein n=2 Tax=Pseudozyma antarctica TaxID=84753 RepID=A0A081CC99_PSEA2|nr:transducin family protein/WD-40 repeat family protein [Moesziomyces antarcticus]GAK64295.1 transducin family protein/WD-40 repeat family protein [Moesziomyces antarcticus]
MSQRRDAPQREQQCECHLEPAEAAHFFLGPHTRTQQEQRQKPPFRTRKALFQVATAVISADPREKGRGRPDMPPGHGRKKKAKNDISSCEPLLSHERHASRPCPTLSNPFQPCAGLRVEVAGPTLQHSRLLPHFLDDQRQVSIVSRRTMSLSLQAGASGSKPSGAGAGPSQLVASLRERGVTLPNFGALKSKEVRGGHRQSVRGLGWSVDGRKLATCGADRVVRIWVPERSVDARASTELKGHSDSVDQLVWHPSHADVVATASADKTVRIWDTRARAQQANATDGVTTVQTPGANINIAYHPSGDYLAVGDKTDTVSVVDTRQNRIVHTVCTRRTAPTDACSPTTVMGTTDEINELCFSPDGSLLLLSSGSGSVHLHTTTDYARVHSHATHTANVFCLQWDPLSRYIATASSDSMVALWDTNEWFAHKMITDLTFPARAIGFSHDGEVLAAAGEDRFIAINATQPNTDADSLHKIPLPPSTTINTLAWHPAKYILAYAGDEPQKDTGTVRIFNL